MRIFLDANVLIAVLNKEYPRFDEAARLLSLAGKRPYQIYVSAVSLAIAWYFVERKSGKKLAAQKFDVLLKHIEVTPCGPTEIRRVSTFPPNIDWEDGLQVSSAESAGCNVIATFDLKDYYFSPIPYFTPKALLIEINKKAALE
jgi:predicted nucleic acid-binding protein